MISKGEKKKSRGSMRGEAAQIFVVERQDGGRDGRKRPEERTQVSNHLPMSWAEKVQQKLFIKETRPTLMKRIVCFPPHLIHSEWNVQSKWCGVAKTFYPPLHINILRLTIDFQTPRDKMWIHIPSTLHKNDNYLKKCATKSNKIFTGCLITL